MRTRVLTLEPECRCGCGQPATDVDHVLALEDGGEPWDWHNLQPLTHACHTRKTDAERRARARGDIFAGTPPPPT